MNWKNIVRLMRVDMKSGRLLRRRKLTKYKDSHLYNYLVYGGSLTLGIIIGALAGTGYMIISHDNPEVGTMINEGSLNLFLSLPTLVLIYSMVFTMFQQIQRASVKFSFQVPYWLPITWEEHTLASVLANLLGFPLASIILIGSAITLFSTFIGQTVAAVLTVLAICVAAFMASSVTEIFRVLQVRFIGAIYKSTGRAAVWVRFIGSLLFFVVFYIIYFYMVSGPGAVMFIQAIVSAQSTIWFVPFVWLSMTLYSLVTGLLLQGFVFLVLSFLFIAALLYSAVLLNRRFGLYEPPAITISHGVYAPKTGLLGRLGFSTAEAAVIRKDFKAFTRRRELMAIFIVPIVVILLPVMQALGASQPIAGQGSLYLFSLVTLLPASAMAISLGSYLMGEEGQAVWRIYASPLSAKSLVKSKYFFAVLFSTLILALTGIVGFLFFHPSQKALAIVPLESFFLALALGSISLSIGIRGADFTEAPRARMIRTAWSLFNMVLCFLAAIGILFPFLPYAISSVIPGWITPMLNLSESVVLSAVISVVLAFAFYRLALRNAKELLSTAKG